MHRFLYVLLFLLFICGCDKKCLVERAVVDIDVRRSDGVELYLVTNYIKDVHERDRYFLTSIKDRLVHLCELDSVITSYSISFYDNTSCSRDYAERYFELKNVESLYERCGRDYLGSFLYKRLEENSSVWYLAYPNEINDTIYCE